MSAPTGGVAVNRDGALVGVEYVGVNPPAAGAMSAVAAADHVHKILTGSGIVTGFGRMLESASPLPIGNFPPGTGLFPLSEVAVPAEWTAECFFTKTGAWETWQNGALILLGWCRSAGTEPATPATGNFLGMNMAGGGGQACWPGFTVDVGTPTPAVAQHCFVQMDKAGNMWFGLAGVLYGPFAKPGGAVIPASAFPMVYGLPFNGGGAAGMQFDEVRFSTSLRYPTSGAAYNPPADPFDSDPETLVLWHLDDIPYGTFFSSAGDGNQMWFRGPVTTSDASPNAITGNLALFDATGSTGNLPMATSLSGTNSNAGPNSGTGTAPVVESIQGLTGNFQLVTPDGVILPAAQVGGVQQVQTRRSPVLVAPPTNPLVSGTIYQNTTGYDLTIDLGITDTVAGTAQWALGPATPPAAFGPAVNTVVGQVTHMQITVPANWYYSLTVSGTATIGAASGIGT